MRIPVYSLLVWVLNACGPGGQAFAQGVATVAWYLEQEAGTDPYQVRYIVTPDYMRSDEGRDDGDFLLYDRGQHRIYSVVRANRSIFEIDGDAAVAQVPPELSISVRQRIDQKAPTVGGVAPLAVELVAGGEVCRSALVVPGFLEPLRSALQEFSLALAVQQARTLDRTPGEYQTPCFLSRYLYASDFHLARGILLADWSDTGERRELTGYETDVAVSDSLFALPSDFRRIKAGGL